MTKIRIRISDGAPVPQLQVKPGISTERRGAPIPTLTPAPAPSKPSAPAAPATPPPASQKK